jgi:nickel transport protein
MAARPRSRSVRTAFAAVLTVLILWLNGSQTWAHNVNVYAYAEDDTVHVKGYFSNGPARNCRVVVFSPEGARLLDGKTDSNGEFSFKAPARFDLRIQLMAGEGHSAEYVLKAEELPDNLTTGHSGSEELKAPLPQQEPEPDRRHPDERETPREQSETPGILTSREIRGIVEEVVEKKIAPVRKMMLEQRENAQGASFEKVLAGIGIIFGLMGFTVYLRMLWRKKES